MKILLIHDKDPHVVDLEGGPTDAMCSERAGGLAVYLAHVERGLRDRGWETASIAFRDDPSDGPAEDGRHALRAFRYRPRPTVVAAVDRIIADERPDVVHVHSMPMLPGRLVNAMRRGRPLVWTFHDVSPTCFRGTRLRPPDDTLCRRKLGLGCVTCGCFRLGTDGSMLGDVVRVATRRRTFAGYRHASRILVPSSYMRSLLVEHDMDGGRVDVIPLFSRYADRDVGPPPASGTPTLLFVGRLTREKGVLAFVDALGTLGDAPWTARLIGDGAERSEAMRRIAAHGLADRVTFDSAAGPAALEAAYRDSDIVVMPSLGPESFGLVGVEAMSLGRPVVAFDSGGVVEWLDDEVTGLLAAHGDVTDLARKIERLVRDPELRERMGAAGRARVRSAFTLARHLDRLTEVYGACAK